MKIGYIPATFLPWVGGAEIQAHNMANKSQELKNSVDVFLLNNEKINNRKYHIKRLNKFLINIVFILKYYFSIDFSYLIQLSFKKFIKNNYSIWHFHSVNYKTLLYIKPLKNLNQKICITFQGADIQKFKNINYGYRFDSKYEKLLIKTLGIVDKVFVISNDVKKELLKLGYKGEIINIPNTVDIKKIENIEIKKIKKTKKCLRLITVARYYEAKKGLDLIEKISKVFIKKKMNFKWTLVGRDSDKLLKKNFIKKNIKYFKIIPQINNNTETYFPSSKLIKIYKENDLYVNLARIESFGITIIEAIASGLPVFTFDTKGANEIVKNNINGFILKNYNPKDMAFFIIKKFKQKYFYKKLKNKSVKKYDLEKNTKIMIKKYN